MKSEVLSVQCHLQEYSALSGVLKIRSRSFKRRYHSSLGVGRGKMLVFSEMSEQVFVTDNLFHWPESIRTMMTWLVCVSQGTLWIFYLVFLLTIFCKVEEILHMLPKLPQQKSSNPLLASIFNPNEFYNVPQLGS